MMGTISSAHSVASAAFDEDRRLTYAVYVLLLLVIIVSTYLHYFQPQVLSVPGNMNVTAWRSPSFEQTTIHDRMAAEERQRVSGSS
jgi:hypothetical protein